MSRTATNGHRERLSQAREQLRSLRDQRRDADENYQRARKALIDSGNVNDQRSAEFLAASAAQSRLADLDRQIDLARDAERDLLAVLSGNSIAPGYSFLNDPETMQTLEGYANTSAPIGRVNLGQYMSAEEVAGMIGTAFQPNMMAAVVDNAPSLREGARFGIMPQLRRPLRLLDLIPSRPIESKKFEYVVESGSLDTAAETVEGAVKPEAGATYTDEEGEAKTIAHWIKLNRQQLDDSEDLGNRLRDRLIYGVLRRLEGQVATGAGTGELIRGILNTTGIGSIAYSASELAADQVLEGIATLIISGAEPNVVAISVTDWKNMLKAKNTNEDYYSGGPFAETARVLWGTATVPVPGLAAGNALVGDTRLGTYVTVREGVNVAVSDSDQDDFVRNRVTLRGEGRFGLAVETPASWVAVDLAA